MRINTQKSFPYPVIRETHDDYIDEEFFLWSTNESNRKPKFELSEDSSIAKFELNYSLSSTAIKRQIANGNAVYLSVFSCKETFFHKVFESSSESNNFVEINLDEISGKIELESYVYIKNDLTIESKTINQEYFSDIFSERKFDYYEGNIIAQAQAFKFNCVPDIFNFSSSLFRLVQDDDLKDGEWHVDTDQDKIIIKAAKNIIKIEQNLTNQKDGESVLANSIYFSAVMHAVILYLNEPELVNVYHWAKVFEQRMAIKNVRDDEPAYKIASILMDWPLSELQHLSGEST